MPTPGSKDNVPQNSVDPVKNQRWLLERVLLRGRWEDWLLLKEHLSRESVEDTLPRLRVPAREAHFLELQLEYRRSIDLDLFTTRPFDSELLQQWVTQQFSKPQIVNRTRGSLCMVAQGVKIDFLLHDYTPLKPQWTEHSIRHRSLEDLCAMKINAVVGRGSKKDFSDLLLLHENGYELKTLLGAFLHQIRRRRPVLGDTESQLV